MPVPMIAIFISTVIRRNPVHWMTRSCLRQSSAPRPRSQVATVRERTTRASQVVTLIAIVVPPLGLIAVAIGLWGVAFSWVDVVRLRRRSTSSTGLGTTVGFHRLFTHRSFETTKTVSAATFAILGSMTMQGPVTQWVTDHRKHHALSDQEGDPHSPHAGFAPGAWGARQGLLPRARRAGSSTSRGWSAASTTARISTTTALIRRIDRMYFVWVVAHLRDPVRDRVRRRRRELAARARGARLGRPDPDLRLPARDLLGQLDLPHVRAARVPLPRREPQQLGRRRARPSARAGTTTTTPSRPRRATGSTGSSSTSSWLDDPRAREARPRLGRAPADDRASASAAGSPSRAVTVSARSRDVPVDRRQHRGLEALEPLPHAVDPRLPAREA